MADDTKLEIVERLRKEAGEKTADWAADYQDEHDSLVPPMPTFLESEAASVIDALHGALVEARDQIRALTSENDIPDSVDAAIALAEGRT